MICSISMDQALGIWSDLWQAFYSDNGFGSDTAEIYAYRLVGHQPVWNHCPCPEGPGQLDTMQRYAWETGVEAKRNLVTLLRHFRQQTLCRIQVDGIPLGQWDDGGALLHRCHVTVIRRAEER